MEKEIKFKPVTEGLGFHPFSDGLPYAPISKATVKTTPRARMGTGAELAGPIIPVLPTLPVMPTRHERARGLPPAAPTSSGFTARAAQTPVSAPVASSVAQPPLSTPLQFSVTPTFGFGYMLKRMIAFGIDTVINTVACVALLGALLWQQNFDLPSLVTPSLALIFFMLLVAFNWTLTTAQEVGFGTSIGKRLFGLHLDGSAAAVFMRAFFFLPSFFFCGVGIVWAVFSSKKRCWHDAVVDIQPQYLS